MVKNCKTLDFLGGCNFRKDKNLGFCRAYGLGPRGRRFESSRPDHYSPPINYNGRERYRSFRPLWPIGGQKRFELRIDHM